MTRPESYPDDNCGLCETCHRPGTRNVLQRTYPLILAGLGPGTIWLCGGCAAEKPREPAVPAKARLRSRLVPPTHLVERPDSPAHLSYFMPLVSAYQPSPERVDNLLATLVEAQAVAKREMRSVVVDQDAVDFFFLVHPNQTVSLCARLRSYEITTPE